MGIIFNADEIFEIAIEIEKNGAEFYEKAAEISTDSEFKKELYALAEMEVDHEKTFETMKKKLNESESESTTYDPDNEIHMYIQAFAKGHVFDRNVIPKDLLSGTESPEKILKIAIGLEKDSILFYLGMKEMVSKDLGKDKVDKIIVQEMLHVSMLSDKLEALGFKS